MDKYSKEFLNKTIKVWQPYSNITLSQTDAIEITENMTALFNFLIASENQTNDKSMNKNILSREKICLNLKLLK